MNQTQERKVVESTVTFKQDGGSYGLKSGYGYWSAFVNDQRINFPGGLESPAQRKSFVAKYYPDATIVEISRDKLVAEERKVVDDGFNGQDRESYSDDPLPEGVVDELVKLGIRVPNCCRQVEDPEEEMF